MLANLPIAFSTVKLKQFRDASNPTAACYQAVVATPFTLSNLRPPTPLPPATITVERYDLDIPNAWGFPPACRLSQCCNFR